MPHDALVQLFPGADLPETCVDALIEIPGMRDAPVPDDIIGPSSMVICKPPLPMIVGGSTTPVPFSLGMVVPGSGADDCDYLVVA